MTNKTLLARLPALLAAQDKACIAQWTSYQADRISRTQVCLPKRVVIMGRDKYACEDRSTTVGQDSCGTVEHMAFARRG